MCSGAEPAAATAAKGAAEVGASAGSLAAANAVGAAGGDALGSLIASNAGAWGVSVAPEIAATGIAATSSLLTPSNVSAGASAANAGMGLVNGMNAKKGVGTAPQVTAPILMPSQDDLAARRARATMLQTLSQRRGRASTILSNDTLGGN